MGYKEILDTHDWVFVRSVSLDPHATFAYPKYFKYVNQFKCKNCICKAFSSKIVLDEEKRLNVPTKFDIFLGSPIWTCEEAQNNTIIYDIIT